jgi:hypothetical protein
MVSVEAEYWAKEDKFCPHCERWLSFEAFPVDRHRHSGRGSWCRECARVAVRKWRKRHRKYELAYNARRRAEYRDANPLRERPCVVCGRLFAKRRNALVCGEVCRRKRNEELRRERLRSR